VICPQEKLRWRRQSFRLPALKMNRMRDPKYLRAKAFGRFITWFYFYVDCSQITFQSCRRYYIPVIHTRHIKARDCLVTAYHPFLVLLVHMVMRTL
jgi:hypothetical protein